MNAIVLRIRLDGLTEPTWISDALGECARDLEAHESEGSKPRLGLIPDPEDPGRYAWEIVVESYA